MMMSRTPHESMILPCTNEEGELLKGVVWCVVSIVCNNTTIPTTVLYAKCTTYSLWNVREDGKKASWIIIMKRVILFF